MLYVNISRYLCILAYPTELLSYIQTILVIHAYIPTYVGWYILFTYSTCLCMYFFCQKVKWIKQKCTKQTYKSNKCLAIFITLIKSHKIQNTILNSILKYQFIHCTTYLAQVRHIILL